MGQSFDRDVAVVFDFGEVLLKTSARAMYEDRFREQGKTEEDLNYFLSEVFTPKARGQANFGTMAEVTAQLVEQFPDWAEDINAFNADKDFIRQVRGSVDGMPEVIEDLKKAGLRVFGLTNWAADTIVPVKNAYPFLQKLDDIMVSGEEGIKKPNPEIFQRASQRFRIAAHDLVFFDDKKTNIDAARKAGWEAHRFEGIQTVLKRFPSLALLP